MNYGAWLVADAVSLRAAQRRWSQNHEPHPGQHQTCSMLAFQISLETLNQWPTSEPLTRRDIENIRSDADFTAQTIYLKEYGNA